MFIDVDLAARFHLRPLPCAFTILLMLGVCSWQKMTSVFGSVLQKNCGFRFGFSFTKLTAVSVFWFGFLHCVLFNMYALY